MPASKDTFGELMGGAAWLFLPDPQPVITESALQYQRDLVRNAALRKGKR